MKSCWNDKLKSQGAGSTASIKNYELYIIKLDSSDTENKDSHFQNVLLHVRPGLCALDLLVEGARHVGLVSIKWLPGRKHVF